jgi:CRISPR/Cas system-associated endoribonuclease Cas2
MSELNLNYSDNNHNRSHSSLFNECKEIFQRSEIKLNIKKSHVRKMVQESGDEGNLKELVQFKNELMNIKKFSTPEEMSIFSVSLLSDIQREISRIG